MALDTKNLLSDLINLGPDAYSNLFTIEMSGLSSIQDGLSVISGRSTTFVSPQRDSSSTTLPYQNIDLSIPTSGTSLPRTLEMTIRLDSGYRALDTLRKLQLIDSDGYYFFDKTKRIGKMHVISYESSNGVLNPVYEWTLYNLFLLSVSKLTFGYESSTNLAVNISFTWQRYEEGIPLNESALRDSISYSRSNSFS